STARPPASAARRSALRPADAVEILQPHKDLSRLRPVRWAEDARRMQLVDDARGAAVADLHAPLQQGRRAEAVLNDDLRRFAEELVAIVRARITVLAGG